MKLEKLTGSKRQYIGRNYHGQGAENMLGDTRQMRWQKYFHLWLNITRLNLLLYSSLFLVLLYYRWLEIGICVWKKHKKH